MLSQTRKIFGLFFFIAAMSGACAAQEPFPGEPPAQQQPPQQPAQRRSEQSSQAAPAPVPAPIPEDQLTAPTIRVNTSVVLVPTLVEKSSGAVLYGLQPKDFTLLDNGVPQNVHVDEDLDSSPVSLVICMERGRDAALEFDKFARLGPLARTVHGRRARRSGAGGLRLKAGLSGGLSKRRRAVLSATCSSFQRVAGAPAMVDAVGSCVALLERRFPADQPARAAADERDARAWQQKRGDAGQLVEAPLGLPIHWC